MLITSNQKNNNAKHRQVNPKSPKVETRPGKQKTGESSQQRTKEGKKTRTHNTGNACKSKGRRKSHAAQKHWPYRVANCVWFTCLLPWQQWGSAAGSLVRSKNKFWLWESTHVSHVRFWAGHAQGKCRLDSNRSPQNDNPIWVINRLLIIHCQCVICDRNVEISQFGWNVLQKQTELFIRKVDGTPKKWANMALMEQKPKNTHSCSMWTWQLPTCNMTKTVHQGLPELR